MRIKIIGDNNCARATRHLLRLAGFAVTEFLPAEVVTQAPHSGFAITIETVSLALNGAPAEESAASPSVLRAVLTSSGQSSAAQTSIPRAPNGAQTLNSWAASTAHTRLAPATQPLNPAVAPEYGAMAGSPTSQPDSSTHGQPATVHGGASPLNGGASSPAIFLKADSVGGEGNGLGDAAESESGMNIGWDEEGKQAEACSTGNIHFDSVDSELEAAVLRHVTQLAGAPVMVDRPGGVVHSERELRIVLPVTGNSRADEAAAVAVEFGVLRGLLDITRRPACGELGGGAAREGSGTSGKSGKARGGRSKWWIFGGVLLAVGAALFGAGLQASPGVSGAVDAKSAQTEVYATETRPFEQLSWGNRRAGFGLRELGRSSAGRAVLAAAVAAAPVAASPAAEPQGQFSIGQIGDPCLGQTKQFVSINQTANTQLVAGTSSRKIYICSIHVVVAAATSVALVEGTGTVCATGTAGVSGFGGATPATGWNFMANGGIALGSGAAAVGAEATSADNLCLFNSGSGQVSGGISYVVQ